jgi:ribosomal protein S18 acetylase RimI-like enzyme
LIGNTSGVTLTLEIVELDEGMEPKFLEHAEKDPFDHFFFIIDWKYDRELTRLYLALEDGEIKGMMVVFRNAIAQVRGERDAVAALLDFLEEEDMEIMVAREHRDLLGDRFTAKLQKEVLMLHLKKGEEKLDIGLRPERLGPDDADEVAALLKLSFKEWWENATGERISKSMDKTVWMGIRDRGKIVALGSTRFFGFASNIFVIATHPDYENRGYATTMVSSLVEQILEHTDDVLIHVFTDNAPAMRVYTKAGFRHYSTYYVVKDARKI